MKGYLDAVAAGHWEYDHPLLKEALHDTKGVIIYQDQVIEVAQALAGFTAGQGELLRRAMSRKRSLDAMYGLRELFMAGAAEKGVRPEVAERVFTKVTAFANFGFPRSHAAAFGLLAYQTAWLRHYYPAEFYASLLNEQPMGFYSAEVVLGDAQRHGLTVLEPDINRSGVDWRLEGDALRTGLKYVKGISGTVAEQIEQEQARGGPFRSLWDFWQRTRLRREPIDNLIAVGTFDFLGLNRRELGWQLGLFYRPLREQLPLALPVEQDQVRLAAPTPWQRTMTDYALLGFSAYAHPMQFTRWGLAEDVATSREVSAAKDQQEIKMAGMVVCRQQPSTANGFVFLTLEDEYGLTNVVVNPAVAVRYRNVIRTEPFVLVTGPVQVQSGTINLLARHLAPLALSQDFVSPRSHDFG